MIKSAEISVIIQGPIFGKDNFNKNQAITEKCISSIRKVLPEAEIIISTWEGSKTDGLDYDKLLLNKDPGGVKFSESKKTNNINRLIISTKNGLKQATRKFCLKIRSDMGLQSDDFLKYFDNFPLTTNKYNIFERKIIVSSLFTLKYFSNNKNIMHTPFHIGDWIYFGLTKDLKTFYDLETVEEPAFSNYLKGKTIDQNFNFFKGVNWRFPPEQHIFLTALKKKYSDINFDHKLDYNDKNIKQSKLAIIDNFIVLEPTIWKFICFKEEYYYMTNSLFLVHHLCWESLYTLQSYTKDYNQTFGITQKPSLNILKLIAICSKLVPAFIKKLLFRSFRYLIIANLKLRHIFYNK